MQKKHFILDAHLDLSMNAMEWNRDLTLPIQELRYRESQLTDKPDRGKGVVNFEELRKGNIGVVVATQIARYVAPENSLPGWQSPEQAWAQTQGQLAWYKAMEDKGVLRMLTNGKALNEHLKEWETNPQCPIGYILSLEGADSLITVDHVNIAHEKGLRIIGPAHYGPGRYANGTDATGHLNPNGKALLKRMSELNMILDITHLCDDAFWDAIDLYNGPMWASHHNCRALVDHNRQLSDAMIKILIERNAVIGVALDAWMMVPNWVRGKSTPESTQCNLEVMTNHIDHICQLSGNVNHVGIGTDLDGAFGKEQCPYDLETIADLQKVADILHRKGYQEKDIIKIYSKNFVDFLNKNLI